MRYRAGWLVPGQVLALTHFEPIVTAGDLAQIRSTAVAALHNVDREFYLLIDNRCFADQGVATLEQIIQAFPELEHPLMRRIVMVLPEVIKHQAHTLSSQQRGTICLEYVDSLEFALMHLRSIDGTIEWQSQDSTFFIKPV